MLNELAKEVHQNAIEHGWWEEERSFGEIISLCHSELSEALEEHRNGHSPTEIYYSCSYKYYCDNKPDDDICESIKYQTRSCEYTKPEGIPIELADCIIRILDFCGKANIDIDSAIKIKHQYNKHRPYRHGGKVI